MTAEIAVMNKSGVALAADSAVTLEMERGNEIVHKIYMTNKLFTLSKYHPIGIMIYGKAELLGIPWETTIKAYREQLRVTKFGTSREYLADFIGFVENANLLFSEKTQEHYFRTSVLGYYRTIKDKSDKKIESYTQKKKITKAKIREIVDSVIGKECEDLEKLNKLPNFSPVDVRNVLVTYASTIKEVKDDVFVKLPMSPNANRNLKKIAGYLFSREIFQRDLLCGVVVAGFGDDEIFPHVKSFEIEGIVNKKAKYKEGREREISEKDIAYIIPFAQREMAVTFMEGVAPTYHRSLLRGLKSLLVDKYPNYVIEEIGNLSKKKQKALGLKLVKIGQGVFDAFREYLREYRRNRHIAPITGAVSFLPKEELAVMAETLVSLTSFKKKMSVDAAETVGGPIDVAVISKGDGFIWIKRKHYFEQKLNPQFTANYYREEQSKLGGKSNGEGKKK